MADIKQAAKWMQQGKIVSSAESQRISPIYMNTDSDLFYTFPNRVRTYLTINDLLADDWEVAS